MRYAEVAVNAPIGYNRTLSYSIPDRLRLDPGQMVWVPLGPRPVQGMVFQLTDRPQVDVTKDIIAPIEPSPLITPLGLKLARWISFYYMASLFDSVTLMLPPGFENRVRSYIYPALQEPEVPAKLTAKGKQALEHLTTQREMRENELVKALGKDGEKELRGMLRRGLLQRRWELPRPRVSYKYDCYIRPAVSGEQAEAGLLGSRASKQKALYEYLSQSQESLPTAIANKEYGTSAVKGLVAKGLLALEWVRMDREPALQRERESRTEANLVLTQEQERALSAIKDSLETGPGIRGHFLLHGVTGSGKTEVYLRALKHCLRMGKKGIFLVPEIALTTQTVHRLNAKFPGKVAVLHSRLSIGERFDQWWRIKDGAFDVVVGPRSALFSPLPNLGLIIIDEEHEWTYKQQDATPYYHAREVALKMAALAEAVVVMGSATPDVETYFKAERGEYTLLELPYRIVPTLEHSPTFSQSHVANRVVRETAERLSEGDLAHVEVCDMREELKEGNRSIFSRPLASALSQCVDRGEQAVLFINRRGSATVVQCRDCGHALHCRRCTVTLTYHATDMRLVCHQCNRRSQLPRGCPQCRSPRIRHLGVGTQRVVEETGKLLPNATTLRWDRDTAYAPRAHEGIVERFLQGEAQVLIGTQMVAKGLHMPNVTLVGVVLADIGLNLPDFRAGERAFQLLCQVAGRAGRGISPGAVIIQTYNPTNYAVEAAAKQDYRLLYDKEVRFRRQQGNPPFNRLVHMTYVHTNAAACQREAEKMGRVMRHRAYSQGLTDVEVIGPAPAFPERVRGRYRWHTILRGRNLHAFLDGMPIPQGWTVDVDPVTVL